MKANQEMKNYKDDIESKYRLVSSEQREQAVKFKSVENENEDLLLRVRQLTDKNAKL